jgi:hypothetical protein
MLYRCVLIADWLTPGLMKEWCVRAGTGRAERAIANASDEIANKITTLNSKLKFFSADFYKGRERLRGYIFSDRRGQGGREGAWQRGEGLFVCVSRKVFRPSEQTVDETLHLFGQLGFARDGG